jgi:hypothetical protein
MMPALRSVTGSPLRGSFSMRFELDTRLAMRRDDLLHHRGQRQPPQMRLSLRRKRGQPPQDIAAALALAAQQHHVFAEPVVRLQLALHLLGDDADRGKRRPEFVGGGGRKPVQLRQMLLPLQHQFGGGKRIGQLAGLHRDTIGIEGGKGHGRGDRAPDAELHDAVNIDLGRRRTRAAEMARKQEW